MKDHPGFDQLQKIIQQDLGHLIAFEYTLRLDNGQEVDSNVGQEPFVFQTGTGEMLPALEAELIQLQAGDSKRVILSPEQAYGPVTTANFKEVPLHLIPEEARTVGRKVAAAGPDGSEQIVDVVAVREATIVLDFNHPLAGKTLHFEVTVLANEKCGGPA